MSQRARSWHARRTLSHQRYSAEQIAAERELTVSVCLPARNEERTIGAILESLLPLRAGGVIDQIVVVDNSSDATAAIARALGVEVHDQQQLLPELGPVLGKGDAMWRALHVLSGEVICFMDADSERFGPHFATGLVGPLIRDPEISFVKGFYRRPFRIGGTVFPDGGGRVTELTGRPLLNLFYPDLAAVEQPLAGEIAARADLLRRLPFDTGYGVDIGLLIDAYREVGLDAIAQVDLEVRQNAHQALSDLGPMAFSVMRAVATRLAREGRLSGRLPAPFELGGEEDVATLGPEPLERPPLATLPAAA